MYNERLYTGTGEEKERLVNLLGLWDNQIGIANTTLLSILQGQIDKETRNLFRSFR